jgi:predicted TIM-barrel fold metal-dependent hydrolase
MRAIDVHVHPSTRGVDGDACGYFRRDPRELPRTDDQFAGLFIRQQAKGLLIGWHPSTVKNGTRNSNEYVIDLASKYPEAFAGVLASLEVTSGQIEAVLKSAEALLKEPNVKGFKFHPPDQGFYPDDRRYYGLWELLAAERKPAMFHTGFTVLGANQDGGQGIALDCGRPIRLDNLARDFPRLKIIAAHPGWPWHEELLGVLTHKKNIYVDTSGYLAEQLPEPFRRAIRGRLQDRTLFGTDFPYVDLEKALESMDRIDLKNEAKEKILLSNARSLFEI